MCLISQSLKPFIAKKDLKVFKVLNKTDKGYVTPYRVQEVELGGLMCGNDKNYDEYNYGLDGYLCQVSIGEGYVHAAIRNVTNHKESNSICVVAYIPKGTKYYVDVEFENVCSKQLKLTDEVVASWDDAVLSKEETMDILSPICDNIDKNNVCSGWMVKSDKAFVHPSEYTEDMKDDIIGVVGDIINNKVIVVALDVAKCEWCKECEKVEDMPRIYSLIEAYNDFNGKEYTNIIKNCKKYKENTNYYPAFDYCLKYRTKGTEKGDWYLPSSGELHTIYNKHRDAINFSLFIMGTSIIGCTSYWASAEASSTYAWGCGTNYAGLDYWGNKWGSGYVRPSFAIEAS